MPAVAPVGTARQLINCFINSGGEIEKRPAFYLHPTLTAYGQNANFKGQITGPHSVPGEPKAAFFRHHYDGLPPTWTAGAGTKAAYIDYGNGHQEMRFWAMKTTETLADFGALLCAASYSEFGTGGYIVETYRKDPTNARAYVHAKVVFTAGEPTADAVVAANDGRVFQMTLGGKGYVVKGTTLYASAVGDPSDMVGTGSGNLDFQNNGQPIGSALALGDYFGQLAIFGEKGVQFYQVDPDFAQVQYLRTVPITVFAARSVTGYGNGDLVFLGYSGIRSLQARDSSNLAQVNDIGSPIDSIIRAAMSLEVLVSEPIHSASDPDVVNSSFFDLAHAIVHPLTGDFWLFLRDKAYVLSRHPAANVLAWSRFDLPTPANGNLSDRNGPIKSGWCADACVVGQTIVYRNFADEMFVYGGASGQEYDDSLATVVLPFLDMGTPATLKHFTGIEMVAEGTWQVEVTTIVPTPGVEPTWISKGTITNGTRGIDLIPIYEHGTQIALRLRCQDESAAKISQIAIHYDGGAEK